ncbi:recombinase family protein [Ideonella livida]|uniref:Recombinase family protein n=1 Tax=Ideonella livida TaxID=2707176 RepID=A0A7C9TI64_9BURK|nr:recombinase family protein [Ideonella livida]NDY90142.1 recombinase family protein [Ideonella livida]
MSRTFAYARVSTVDQLTENQAEQIAQAGYMIEPHRFIEEKVSGSVPAGQRPGFVRLLEKLEPGDTLVVTKLDRIGRDSVDVQQTVHDFSRRGVRLVVLQLGNLDLTSTAGALMVKVLAAVADFERGLIVERTQAGLERAKAEGKRLGRPPKTTESQRQAIRQALTTGATVSQVARDHGISRAAVVGIRDAGASATDTASATA